MPSSWLQVVNNLFQTYHNKLGTSSANTTCWQLVNRLVTTCLQTCNNLCVFTRVGCAERSKTRLGTSFDERTTESQEFRSDMLWVRNANKGTYKTCGYNISKGGCSPRISLKKTDIGSCFLPHIFTFYSYETRHIRPIPRVKVSDGKHAIKFAINLVTFCR